ARPRSLRARAQRRVRDIVQSSYRCSVPRDCLGDSTGGFVAHYLGRRKGRATLASTCRTERLDALARSRHALCAWLPARQPARLAFGDPIAESRAIRRFPHLDAMAVNASFIFDSSQHLSPRSKLLPNSHVARGAQDVVGVGRNASW